jgi:hypothetical protein
VVSGAVTWHAIAMSLLAVIGIACCGIGAIILFASGMSDNPFAAEKASREGCGFGVAGLVLLALASGMAFL